MYELKKGRWLKHLDFFLMDLLSIEGLYFTLVWLLIPKSHQLTFDIHKKVGIAMFFVLILMYAIHDFYKNVISRSLSDEILESIKYMLSLSFGVLVYLYLTKTAALFSRALYVFTVFLGVLLICIVRTIHKFFLRKRLARHKPEITVITDYPEGSSEFNRYQNQEQIKEVFYQDEDDNSEKEIELIRKFEAYRNVHAVDEVIVDLHEGILEKRWIEYLLASGLTAHIRITRNLNKLPNTMIENVCGVPVLTTCNSVVRPIDLILKRAMDIMGGIVGMFLTGIAFLIFAPIIKVQSPGPVFYTQTRIGRNGRKFKIYKFRSMYRDADARKKELEKQNEMKGFMFKLENDPRITPIGRFMRKYSIDELPQFWNILKGDMSLVGTRPPTLDEWEQYSPHHRARMSAKPGLTGIWQVSGRNDIVDFEKVVSMDTEYIHNWSIFTDIGLILRTIVVVFQGSGK